MYICSFLTIYFIIKYGYIKVKKFGYKSKMIKDVINESNSFTQPSVPQHKHEQTSVERLKLNKKENTEYS